jgi:succinyl-diaminopimelate desuccinylase
MAPVPLPVVSAETREAIERARGLLDDERIADLVMGMVGIASPTGEERPLAEFVAGHLVGAGVQAEVQSIDDRGANVIGRLGGGGDGPTLMLCAPLDTAFSGQRDEDRPWLGDDPRADFAVAPTRDGTRIVGMGAENPKGYAAAAIVALEALAAAGLPARGEASVALVSGSMPVDGRPGFDHRPVGHGSGIEYLLSHGTAPDFAIMLKPGYSVVHEEVGLAWFRLIVHGTINYTGIRHKGPYRNPIIAAARLVTALEAWFPDYTAANTAGLVAPQGSINAIQAGSADRAAFIPATCEIDLDLRVAPGSSPDDVRRQLEAALDTIRAGHRDLDVELVAGPATPGTATDPDSWVVRSLVRAWEDLEGRAHEPVGRGSGATDGAILRSHGIPTARIGLPPGPPVTPNPYPGFSMGVVDITGVHRLADVLIGMIADTISRTREEVGLAVPVRGY